MFPKFTLVGQSPFMVIDALVGLLPHIVDYWNFVVRCDKINLRDRPIKKFISFYLQSDFFLSHILISLRCNVAMNKFVNDFELSKACTVKEGQKLRDLQKYFW